MTWEYRPAGILIEARCFNVVKGEECGADWTVEAQRTLAGSELIASLKCPHCGQRARMRVEVTEEPGVQAEHKERNRAKAKQESML
jgi:hypothetical protein